MPRSGTAEYMYVGNKYARDAQVTRIRISGSEFLNLGESADLTLPQFNYLSERWELVPVDGIPYVPPAGANPFKAAVATVADLPLVGNNPDDIRLVRSARALYLWVAAINSWVVLAGGGSSTGGGGAPQSVSNLFIQQGQPTVDQIVIDSLWIPLDGAGLPQTLGNWQVFTGTGQGGDGGDLVLDTSRPNPAMTCLWIPVTSDGNAKSVSMWELVPGPGGEQGNPNLVISVSRPSIPVPPLLWLPQAVDGTLRSPDTWEVFT